MQKETKSKVRRKLEQARNQHGQLEKHLTSQGGPLVNDQRKAIIELPVNELLARLQDGRLKCLDVLQAYQAKVLRYSVIPK